MRRTRHTRRRTRHKRKHRRRRTRRHKRRRKTRHRRGGRGPTQVWGGYKENLVPHSPVTGGGKKPSWAVSDYPPGFSKFTTRDKRQWKKIKKRGKK